MYDMAVPISFRGCHQGLVDRPAGPDRRHQGLAFRLGRGHGLWCLHREARRHQRREQVTRHQTSIIIYTFATPISILCVFYAPSALQPAACVGRLFTSNRSGLLSCVFGKWKNPNPPTDGPPRVSHAHSALPPHSQAPTATGTDCHGTNPVTLITEATPPLPPPLQYLRGIDTA